jgi:flavodoxin
MKTLVIYDSVFGNTKKVAEAIGEVLKDDNESCTYSVNETGADMFENLDLIIVGSPTRKFSPTPATKQFISHLERKYMRGVKVATFDTRVDENDINSSFLKFMLKSFGYAAKPLANRLKRKGGKEIVKPKGFFVYDTKGPLKEGELERAAEWARKIKEKV